VFSVDMAAARAAARGLGGTINDVFVAGVAGGAGAYHRAHGVDVDELRASIAVSTRRDHSAAGNAFLPTRVLVPAGLPDPALRFRVVHERLAVVKAPPAAGVVAAVAAALAALPPAVVVRLARAQVGTVDFATSNVRGVATDLYIGGARVVANYPMGPTGGTAFNATLLSSGTQLDVGVACDAAAVPDPGVLRRCLAAGMQAVIAASARG
jgi:hypothetical protein